MNKNDEAPFDALLDKAAGADRAAIEKAAQGNKALSQALSKLSSDDMEKLSAVLGDRDRMKSMLATPQAQKLLEKLLKGKQSQENDGAG